MLGFLSGLPSSNLRVDCPYGDVTSPLAEVETQMRALLPVRETEAPREGTHDVRPVRIEASPADVAVTPGEGRPFEGCRTSSTLDTAAT